MTDSEPPVLDPAEQFQPVMEEARVARLEAKEAVDRIQQRIERLVFLSKALNGPEADHDAREPSEREPELALSARVRD